MKKVFTFTLIFGTLLSAISVRAQQSKLEAAIKYEASKDQDDIAELFRDLSRSFNHDSKGGLKYATLTDPTVVDTINQLTKSFSGTQANELRFQESMHRLKLIKQLRDRVNTLELRNVAPGETPDESFGDFRSHIRQLAEKTSLQAWDARFLEEARARNQCSSDPKFLKALQKHWAEGRSGGPASFRNTDMFRTNENQAQADIAYFDLFLTKYESYLGATTPSSRTQTLEEIKSNPKREKQTVPGSSSKREVTVRLSQIAGGPERLSSNIGNMIESENELNKICSTRHMPSTMPSQGILPETPQTTRHAAVPEASPPPAEVASPPATPAAPAVTPEPATHTAPTTSDAPAPSTTRTAPVVAAECDRSSPSTCETPPFVARMQEAPSKTDSTPTPSSPTHVTPGKVTPFRAAFNRKIQLVDSIGSSLVELAKTAADQFAADHGQKTIETRINAVAEEKISALDEMKKLEESMNDRMQRLRNHLPANNRLVTKFETQKDTVMRTTRAMIDDLDTQLSRWQARRANLLVLEDASKDAAAKIHFSSIRDNIKDFRSIHRLTQALINAEKPVKQAEDALRKAQTNLEILKRSGSATAVKNAELLLKKAREAFENAKTKNAAKIRLAQEALLEASKPVESD